MHTTDPRQNQPDMPEFLPDARLDGLRDTYLGLRSFGQGMAVETLATKLGISESTAHRHIRRLQEHGVLQVKKQFQDGRQRSNFYLFPTPQWWVDPGPVKGCHEGCQSPGEGCHGVTATGQVARGVTDAPNSPGTSSSDRDTEKPDDGFPESKSKAEVPRRNRPPWRLFPRNSPYYTHPDTRDLVEFFTDHVLARDIAEKGKARKIPTLRRTAWRRSANDLLDDHPVEELKSVISWLFDHCLGYLPFLVTNSYTGHFDHRERKKITRLAQILEHYPQIVATMSAGAPLEPVEVQEMPTIKPRPWDFYDYGEGFPMEDQVAVLVELFAKTKHREVSDYDLFGWRKTFRIMLDHWSIPFDDIVMVVEALGNTRLCLDFARYNAPYDLVRRRGEVLGTPGEWENILGSVKLALQREERRPKNPPRAADFDDDEYIPYSRRSYDDDCGAVDMAANAEERHHRYLARQRAPRSPWDDEAESA